MPDDDRWLAERFGCTVAELQEHVRPVLQRYFKRRNRFLYQKRLVEEKIFVDNQSEKQRQRRKSGWDKQKSANRGSPAVEPDSSSGSTPTPTPTQDSESESSHTDRVSGGDNTADRVVPESAPAGAPNGAVGHASHLDLDAELYRHGRRVLGPRSGGVITKLKNAKGVAGALEVIQQAQSKAVPMEYVQGAIRSAGKSTEWGLY